MIKGEKKLLSEAFLSSIWSSYDASYVHIMLRPITPFMCHVSLWQNIFADEVLYCCTSGSYADFFICQFITD